MNDLNGVIARMQVVNEQQVAQSLGISPQQPTAEQVALFRGFQSHCVQKGAMPKPTPALVASWLETLDSKDLDAACRAVEVVCDFQFFANPIATLSVRTVLERKLRPVFPHSWDKADRLVFASCPPEIRSIILKREQQRDTALRRSQNKLASEIKKVTANTEKEAEHEQR
jgi:hypothetical protein